VYILTINVYITLPDMLYITLYMDEIPSDHTTWRWVFVYTFLTELIKKNRLLLGTAHYCTV